MKAAIVIDPWKLKIFERRLKAGGFEWGQHDGPIKNTILLTVETDETEKLARVVKAANDECATS